MSRPRRIARAGSLGLALLLSAGCLPVLEVRSRTRVLEGGAAQRETVISKTRRKAEGERESHLNARPIAEDLAATLGQGYASVARSDDEIRLSGTFAHAGDIAPDFRRAVSGLPEEAKNRVVLVLEDCLFGTRYVYRERYADAIPPEDVAAKKLEFVRFCADFARAAVRTEFQRDYETAALEARIEELLAPLVDDLVEIYWSERASLGRADSATGKTGLQRLLERVARRLGRDGLRLDFEQDADALLKGVASFAAREARDHLRRKDGRPLASHELAWLEASGSEPAAGLVRLQDGAARATFGTNEAAKAEFDRLIVGITGTFGGPLAEAEFRFDCAVTMPGLLLSTNGVLESETSAFWLFEGDQIFPRGQVLEAESFVFDPLFLGRLDTPHQPDRRAAVRLIRALEDADEVRRARLRERLREALRAGSLEALAPPKTPEAQGDHDLLKKAIDAMRG